MAPDALFKTFGATLQFHPVARGGRVNSSTGRVVVGSGWRWWRVGGWGRNKRNRNKSHRRTWLDWGFWLPVEIKEAHSCFRNRSYVDELPRNPGDEEPGVVGGGLKRDFGEVQYMSKRHPQRKNGVSSIGQEERY